MPLDKTKVLNGPFTLKLTETGSPDTDHATFTGLKYDAIKVNWTEKEGSQDLEDGSTDTWAEGADLEIVMVVSEWDTTKIEALEDNLAAINQITADFTNKSRTATVTNPDSIRIEMEDLKLKLTIKKSVGVGVKMTDTWVVAASA